MCNFNFAHSQKLWGGRVNLSLVLDGRSIIKFESPCFKIFSHVGSDGNQEAVLQCIEQ
jgi:hypothetical protein